MTVYFHIADVMHPVCKGKDGDGLITVKLFDAEMAAAGLGDLDGVDKFSPVDHFAHLGRRCMLLAL
jgi:hypothetical protein